MENDILTTKQPSERGQFDLPNRGSAANQEPEYIGERVYILVRFPIILHFIQNLQTFNISIKNKPEGSKAAPANDDLRTDHCGDELPSALAVPTTTSHDDPETSYQTLLQNQRPTTIYE